MSSNRVHALLRHVEDHLRDAEESVLNAKAERDAPSLETLLETVETALRALQDAKRDFEEEGS